MPYQPEYDGPIAGYVANFVSKNYWRVERTQERDDVFQEARCVFLKVSGRYPDVDAPHFMALFKTAWQRRFTDLANADTARRVEVPLSMIATPPDRDEYEYEYDPPGELDNDGAASVLLRQAPSEVKQVINLFLNAPQEILELALAGWNDVRDGRYSTGGSRRLCRLLNIPDDVDVMAMAERHFRG